MNNTRILSTLAIALIGISCINPPVSNAYVDLEIPDPETHAPEPVVSERLLTTTNLE